MFIDQPKVRFSDIQHKTERFAEDFKFKTSDFKNIYENLNTVIFLIKIGMKRKK